MCLFNFCSGLKHLITPVLANVMENDFSKMWSFEKFFREIRDICSMKVLVKC